MLEMENERLDFTDQLAPEDGYELAACVGTTYSLDMSAMLGACMSLAGGVFRSGSSNGNPVGAFASIAKLRGKVAVFCEKGRIKDEDRTGQLAILLEPLVNQVIVRRPRSAGTSISSFHPKVWLLDFVCTANNEHRYRLLVTSKNLTFSGSWDVAARLDGHDTGSFVPESGGIVRFLDYLRNSNGVEGDRETRRLLKRLSDAIATVRFEVDSTYFEDYEFLPFGPSSSGLLDASETPPFTDRFTKAVVVSPFLGNDGPLKRLAQNRIGNGPNENFHLFSRESELAKIDSGLLAKYSCYAPKDWLSDVSLEDDGEGAPNAVDYSDLHAKLYLTERYADRNLYLGSLNASHNGMVGNVEVLLRLQMKKRRLSADDLVASLAGDKKPFGPYDPNKPNVLPEELSEEQIARRIELDRSFHAAAKLLEFRRAEAFPGEERMVVDYLLPLFNGFDTCLALSLSPYLVKVDPMEIAAPGGRAEFKGVPANNESEFFVLEGISESDDYRTSCLVRCPDSSFVCPDERDGRIKRVLEGILEANSGVLASYIALAFGMQPPSGDAAQNRGSAPYGGLAAAGVSGGIYESLLKVLAVAPNAREQLDYAKLMLSFLPSKYDDAGIKMMRDMVAQFDKAVRRHG